MAELLSAGFLKTGQQLVPKMPKCRDRVAQILPDGRIDVDGTIFETLSGAGYSVRKKSTNGWSFWLVDVKTKKSLASVRREYVEQSSLSLDVSDDDDEETLEESVEDASAGA